MEHNEEFDFLTVIPSFLYQKGDLTNLRHIKIVAVCQLHFAIERCLVMNAHICAILSILMCGFGSNNFGFW